MNGARTKVLLGKLGRNGVVLLFRHKNRAKTTHTNTNMKTIFIQSRFNKMLNCEVMNVNESQYMNDIILFRSCDVQMFPEQSPNCFMGDLKGPVTSSVDD